jgi:hypothetical protein
LQGSSKSKLEQWSSLFGRSADSDAPNSETIRAERWGAEETKIHPDLDSHGFLDDGRRSCVRATLAQSTQGCCLIFRGMACMSLVEMRSANPAHPFAMLILSLIQPS